MSSTSAFHIPEGYVIRAAEARDLPRLPAVERAATQLFLETDYAILAQDDGYDAAQYRDWFEYGAIWLAEANGEIAGFAVADQVDGEGFYDLLCVHPAHAKRGLGRALTDAIKAWAAARGYTTLTMTTFPHVPWNAPMFERMGFRILREDELSPGLRTIRQEEIESGLAPEERVFMSITLSLDTAE